MQVVGALPVWFLILGESTPPPLLECDVNCGFSVDAVYQVEVVGFFPGVFSISVDMLVFC